MGGSRNASGTLTGCLHLHFMLKTAPRHVARPPIQARSPISQTTGNDGAVWISACCYRCTSSTTAASLCSLAEKCPLLFFSGWLSGLVLHQSTSRATWTTGLFPLPEFHKTLQGFYVFNASKSGCSLTTVMLFALSELHFPVIPVCVCVCVRARGPESVQRWVWPRGSWWAAGGRDTGSPEKWSLSAGTTASSCYRWEPHTSLHTLVGVCAVVVGVCARVCVCVCCAGVQGDHVRSCAPLWCLYY